MNMAWTILLALVVEAGGHHVPPPLDHARPASDATVLARGPAPSRSLSIARRSWHRACSGYRTLAGSEEFDTEEVDETWMVHLDAIASVPGSWLDLAWSRSRSSAKPSPGLAPSPPPHVPLRC
jgi:hypothetical protein